MSSEIKVKFGVGEGKICFLLLIFNYLFIHICYVLTFDNVLYLKWIMFHLKACGFNEIIVVVLTISLLISLGRNAPFTKCFVSFQSPVMLTYLRLQVSASFSDVAAA